MSTMLIAMDRAPSGRRIDADGHLHVEMSNMTKAAVNPYYGSEIPGYEELGLDPTRLYQMFRPPEEISKGIDTLNGKPVLFDHKMTTADNHQHMLTVGCTGTKAAFDGTYGVNSMSLWDGKAIRAVNSQRKRQLSCGYRYRPDMTPGEYQGLHYDGKITDIEFQHVALVVEGRAGPDVLVGDEAMKLNSRTALMISGAITGAIKPKLAEGAKVDLASALKDVTSVSFAMDGAPQKLADAVAEIVKPHLAEDQNIDDLADVLATITPIAQDEDMIEDEKPDDDDEDKKAKASKPMPKKKDEKPAMDEKTVQDMIAAAVEATRAEGAEIGVAQQAVRPIVGEIIGLDSAAKIYKVALDQMKVDLTDVPEVGYKAMFNAMNKAPAPVIANDAAPSADARTTFYKSFPALANIGTIHGGQ